MALGFLTEAADLLPVSVVCHPLVSLSLPWFQLQSQPLVPEAGHGMCFQVKQRSKASPSCFLRVLVSLIYSRAGLKRPLVG